MRNDGTGDRLEYAATGGRGGDSGVDSGTGDRVVGGKDETIGDITDDDFNGIDLSDKPEIPPDTGWRWERAGSGKYKGKYWIWRRSQNGVRLHQKGGYFNADSAKKLPARAGKGNRTHTRKSHRVDADSPTSDSTVNVGRSDNQPEINSQK